MYGPVEVREPLPPRQSRVLTLEEEIVRSYKKRKAYKPKKEKDPLSLWKSAWLVTINTNQNNPGLLQPLKKVWDYITQHITSFVYGRGYIDKVIETNRVIELSGKYHRLHLHTKLEITTRGFASLDYVKIQNFINKQLRQIPSFKGVYFNAKLIENYNQAMLIQEYLEKDPYIYEEVEYPGFEII